MKIKSIVSLSAAAIMVMSAVSASAATLPIPKDNNDAFRLAESFYYDGLYYEAKGELGMVSSNAPGYDEAKATAWGAKIDAAISKLEKGELFDKIQWLNDEGLYYEAQDVIAELNSRSDITQEDYYSIRWWEDVIAKKIANLNVVRTERAAINRVKSTGFALSSNYEWFSPVQVEDGYHVYVKTQLPGGGSKDVAAFRVSTSGDVVRVF